MKKLKVGMIGAGIMGKAHSIAISSMPMFFWPAPAIPERYILADATPELAEENAARYGYEKSTGDWRDVISDSSVDVIHIVTPNDSHAEVAIAAARAGKHILCEKPIARTTEEAREMLGAARKAGIVHQLAFNYRRTPAVALAKKYIEEGAIGRILSYHGTYYGGGYDPSGHLQWRHQKSKAGMGVIGDIGTHAIDLARYLVGDADAVSGILKTYVPERPLDASNPDGPKGKVDVDDEASFMLKFSGGATGVIEASGCTWGRDNFITFDIYGERGSIYFNYNHRDELQVCFASDDSVRRGYQTIKTGPQHPYGFGLWHCPELGIGFSEIKAVEMYCFYKAISDGAQAEPNFEDGVKISMICDAVERSSKSGLWEKTGC
jgi:predicted dehydrogenase